MDDLLKNLSIPGTLSLAVMVVIAVFFTRRTIELLLPHLKQKNPYVTKFAQWYNQIILYAIPLAYGALFAIIPSKFLFGDVEGYLSKLFAACTVAWFSGFLYKILKKVILRHYDVNVKLPDSPVELPPEV